MERDLIIKTLRYCVNTEDHEGCLKCPWRTEDSFPSDADEDPFAEGVSCCSDILMLEAAKLLEEDGK